MRGLIGGLLTGGLVSVFGLGVASVVSEQPAGIMPPEAPLVDAPQVDPVPDGTASFDGRPSTPVGSVSIEEPQAPALPEGEATAPEPAAPEPEAALPRADTDPLDEPEVMAIEGAMEAPDAPQTSNLISEPVAPVLPNPQSLAPQTPNVEADLTVSTTPAQPTIVIEPDPEMAETAIDPDTGGDDFFVVDLGADAAAVVPQELPAEVTTDPIAPDPEVSAAPDTQPEVTATDETPAPEDIALIPDAEAAQTPTSGETPTQPRVQLGGANALLTDRETSGVIIRRPGADATIDEAETEAPASNALVDFAADAGDTGSTPLMSIVLIDDGSMSAASAALAGLPFSVTIAIDPALPNAADLMAAYRADGFEVAAIAKLPEGAAPSDVEVNFQSVFSTLPETIAVLDIGDGGLQSDRAVTEQAMDILASQGRGFITVSQGLNMAGRAAEQAGVPAVVVYRDLDIDGQDARVVRRFVDQAAFRARQESGVVLVGRVRPDTISALILWGTANQGDQVAVVPVSAVLSAQ